MQSVCNGIDIVWNFGRPWRVWPFSDGKRLLVTLATGRPGGPKRCEVYCSQNGVTWDLKRQFFPKNPRATSTGQPFITSSGVFLVPVWDVEYYSEGKNYFGIYRSDDGGESWELVFEDPNGTYANHFFESPDGSCLYIGVGSGGGGKEGDISFRPGGSYLLQSSDEGRTWSKCLIYDKPCSLYQGVATNAGEVFLTTREQKVLLRGFPGLSDFQEIHIGNYTRCISYIKDLNKYVISSNSSIFVSNDCIHWSVKKMPMVSLYLRYPTFAGGLLYFTAVGRKSIVVATDLRDWYLINDFSNITSSSFARMALFKNQIFCGSEFDGLLACFSTGTEKKRITFSTGVWNGIETCFALVLGDKKARSRLYGGTLV